MHPKIRKISAPIKIESAAPPPNPRYPTQNEEFYGYGGFPAERTQKFLAPKKLAQPFPAPELRTRILRTRGFFWINLWDRFAQNPFYEIRKNKHRQIKFFSRIKYLVDTDTNADTDYRIHFHILYWCSSVSWECGVQARDEVLRDDLRSSALLAYACAELGYDGEEVSNLVEELCVNLQVFGSDQECPDGRASHPKKGPVEPSKRFYRTLQSWENRMGVFGRGAFLVIIDLSSNPTSQ